ncbi:CRISPR-associated helicase Cas3' [Corynebacterium nasicanis]|uniref:CRISPR-associated helicase Cas3 n=1 Tax=Corynebacterium nasicanis TaxID=1448267 RepID=A0ABW1QC30_9CORY
MAEFRRGASAALASLWAKLDEEGEWMSLPQHLVDTACVAALLWDEWLADSVKRSLCRATGLGEGQLRSVLVFLAGVHDVGKATRTFVHKAQFSEQGASIFDGIEREGLSLTMSRREADATAFQHGLVGEVIVEEWLSQRGFRVAGLASVVGAHHGISTEAGVRGRAGRIVRSYPPEWRAVHEEILDGMARASGFEEVLPLMPEQLNPEVTMPLVGLVIMADWIASNQHAFPLAEGGDLLERVRCGYRDVELTAPWRVAVADKGTPDDFFRTTFGWPAEFMARPVQRAALEAVESAEGACLLIIEAPTGEGKTEAALAAGQRLAADLGAQGLLLAAPTMGTSNGLFPRALEWAERNTAEGEVTSMNLVHSRKLFSQDFSRLKVAGVGTDEPGHGSVVARNWMQGPKKAMLSNFVVATVDQVLLMALQMRHSMLRHIGLAGKVIIVDEVHSYDLYMTSYLQMALKWLARYGVPVILLSATLPKETKKSLVEAYRSQFSHEPIEDMSEAYPLLTVVDKKGVREVEVEPRPTDMEASISVIPEGPEALGTLVDDLIADGGCLLIICNTVRRAQETYREFSTTYPGEVELHHSAFMAAERAHKEDALRVALGPDSHRGAGRPERCLIVATQVAEQSLDIDADVLITDIAPMDLLIQRIGRIHRHRRPDEDRPPKLRPAQVYVRGIVQREPFPLLEGGSAAIYEPAILMSTLAHLPVAFRRPDDISSLVQATYSPGFVPPADWAVEYAKAKATMRKNMDRAESRASTFQIPIPELASELGQLFERYHSSMEKPLLGEEAGAAQVRDTEPTFEAIPIIGTDYGYRPLLSLARNDSAVDLVDDFPPEHSMAFHLASSVLRLPPRLARGDAFEGNITRLERDTPAGWEHHHLLKGKVALRLDENGEIDLNGTVLRYSSEFGLETLDSSPADRSNT